MDKLIEELVEEFKKQDKKIDKMTKKQDCSVKIVAKTNENGCVEVLGINGSQTALLSMIVLILQEMEKHADDSAENMATIILTALKMVKKIHE